MAASTGQCTARRRSFAGTRLSRRPSTPLLNRVLIPLDCSVNRFTVTDCVSPFMTLAGAADIERSAWALPVAQLDVAKPPPAAGIGGLAVHGKKGLTAQWQGLKGGAVNLTAPWLLSDPGRLNVTDLQAGNVFCTQEYRLWKDALNPYGTSVKLTYTAAFPFIFNTTADGNEAFLAFANANPLLDRPVTVTGLPFDIRSKNSALIVAANKAWKLIYLIDDNILFDNYDPKKPKATLPAPLALALHNALFRVTPVNGFLLFGALADDMLRVEKGSVFLTLGMYAYVPTLPDPYAANLGVLQGPVRARRQYSAFGNCRPDRLALAGVADAMAAADAQDTDQVEVSFHFAPLQNQFAIAPAAAQEPGQAASCRRHPRSRPQSRPSPASVRAAVRGRPVGRCRCGRRASPRRSRRGHLLAQRAAAAAGLPGDLGRAVSGSSERHVRAARRQQQCEPDGRELRVAR